MEVNLYATLSCSIKDGKSDVYWKIFVTSMIRQKYLNQNNFLHVIRGYTTTTV